MYIRSYKTGIVSFLCLVTENPKVPVKKVLHELTCHIRCFFLSNSNKHRTVEKHLFSILVYLGSILQVKTFTILDYTTRK